MLDAKFDDAVPPKVASYLKRSRTAHLACKPTVEPSRHEYPGTHGSAHSSADFVQNGKLKMPRIFSANPRLVEMMAAFLIHNG